MPGETDTGPAENAEKLEGDTDDDGADAAERLGLAVAAPPAVVSAPPVNTATGAAPSSSR